MVVTINRKSYVWRHNSYNDTIELVSHWYFWLHLLLLGFRVDDRKKMVVCFFEKLQPYLSYFLRKLLLSEHDIQMT